MKIITIKNIKRSVRSITIFSLAAVFHLGESFAAAPAVTDDELAAGSFAPSVTVGGLIINSGLATGQGKLDLAVDVGTLRSGAKVTGSYQPEINLGASANGASIFPAVAGGLNGSVVVNAGLAIDGTLCARVYIGSVGAVPACK